MKIAHFWDLQTFPFLRTCVLSKNLGNIRKNRGPLFRTNGNRRKIARSAPKFSRKIRAIRRGTSGKRAAQAQKQCSGAFYAMQSNADAFAQFLEAMRARCVRKLRKKSRKSAKNRAHFRRPTHRTTTNSALIDANGRYGPSIDRTHV